MSKNTQLAQRFSEILYQLNQGKRLDTQALAAYFGVNLRTIQRDFNERLYFLEWEEQGPRYYKLNLQKLGVLTEEDIQRFATFASVSNLFPKLDRVFYQEKLTESVQVKGFQYEEIKHLKKEFDLLQKAINKYRLVDFNYTKSGQKEGKFYKVAPYSLINKNGVWYLIGIEEDRKKTFCFTQMSMLRVLNETFEPNQQFLAEIKNNDSISHGNQLSEVVIKVDASVAHYFTRRNLLPNQETIRKLENGELLLSCKNIHELEIIPLVQYWIPFLTIVSPNDLQERMISNLQKYILCQ